MEITGIMAALVDALNGPTRPTALFPLARVKYPRRELAPRLLADGSLTVTLALYGWEYKHRGPRPKPPPVDTAAIQTAFNAVLPDGCRVSAVQYTGTSIILNIKYRR